MLSKAKSVNASGEVLNAPIQVFEIYLQKEDFFPGEVISGKLLVLTDQRLETEGIYLKFEGKAGAKWETREAHLCGLQEAEYVRGRRIYFSNVFHYDAYTIPEGSTALPFEFELPSQLPSTIYSGVIMRNLQIIYSIEAIIRTHEADYRQKKPFIVKGLLNLNRYPELCLPVSKARREVTFESFWSSSKHSLILTFSIPKQGFVPGEKFESMFSIEFNAFGNHIQKLLEHAELSLLQEIELRVGTKCKIRRRTIATQDTMQCSLLKRKMKLKGIRLSFEMTIPEDVMISYESHAKDELIKIRYFLRIGMVQTSFPYKLKHIQIPIKIGTVWIQARKTIPILLLAPVPLILPKPKMRSEPVDGNEEAENYLQTIPLSDAVAFLPEILLNSELKVDGNVNGQVCHDKSCSKDGL